MRNRAAARRGRRLPRLVAGAAALGAGVALARGRRKRGASARADLPRPRPAATGTGAGGGPPAPAAPAPWDPDPAPVTGPSGGGRHGVQGTVWLLLGVALLAGACAGFVGLRGKLREERAFSAAEPCPARAPRGEPCLRTFPATVLGTERHSSRSGATYGVRLRTAEGHSATVTGLGVEPLAGRLARGDAVKVSTWRGEITALARGKVTQRPPGTPASGPQIHTTLGMEGTVLGAWSWWMALCAFRGTAVRGTAGTAGAGGRGGRGGLRGVLRPPALPLVTTALLPLLPALLTRNGDGVLPVAVTLATAAGSEALALRLFRRRLLPRV